MGQHLRKKLGKHQRVVKSGWTTQKQKVGPGKEPGKKKKKRWKKGKKEVRLGGGEKG